MNRQAWEQRQERNRQIVKGIAAGKSYQELARVFGLTAESVRQIAKDWDIVATPKIRASHKLQSIIADYTQGAGEEEIAERYEVSVGYISNLLKKYVSNYVPPKRRAITRRNQRIVEQFKLGRSIPQIAGYYDIHESYVRRILVQAGVLKKKFTRRKSRK